MANSLIGKLYAIERQIQSLGPEEKQKVRQEQVAPQLNKIRQWLDKTLHTTLPKGLLGKNWEKLTTYTRDGRLSIDDNTAENGGIPK